MNQANAPILAGQTEDEQELFDEGYVAGKQAAYGEILDHAFRALGVNDPKGHAAKLQAELMDARRAIKELWEVVRDEPYPEELSLPDVIEKIAGEFIE